MSYPFTLDDCRKEAARMAEKYGCECAFELAAHSSGEACVWVRIGSFLDASHGFASASLDQWQEAEKIAFASRSQKQNRTVRDLTREAAALGFRLEPHTEATR